MRMNQIFGGKKIVIFGTGSLALKLTGMVELFEGHVESYVDNNQARWNTEWENKRIESPDTLRSIESEAKVVFIGSSYFAEISVQLRGMGLIENVHFFSPDAIHDRVYEYFAEEKLARRSRNFSSVDTDVYVRPDDVHAEMGGSDEELDPRLSDVIQLMSDISMEGMNTFLDIGMGRGQLAKWLASRGKQVTGTGIHVESYEVESARFRNEFGIDVVECPVEQMPFPDGSFDAVVLSHVLEHCPNVGIALQEIRRVLKDNGALFLFVPPAEDIVCSGHISVGWNVGQLLYVLLLNGFDVKTGSFARYNYNVCAVVRKSNKTLPPLRGDYGDLHILNQHDLLPLPILTPKGIDNAFWGNITSINWPGDRFKNQIQYLKGHIPGQ
jgi:2-polyprenyl-3-methyl-5-hydroxy-6-metoxy-1,4-benzoquinol methylase